MLRAGRLRRLVVLLRWRLCLVVRVALRRCSCQLARWVLLSCSVVRLRRLRRRRRRVRLVLLVRVRMMRRRRRVPWQAWLWYRVVATLRRRVMRLRLLRRRREARRARRRLHLSRHCSRLTRGKWDTTSRLAVLARRARTAVCVSWRMRCAD